MLPLFKAKKMNIVVAIFVLFIGILIGAYFVLRSANTLSQIDQPKEIIFETGSTACQDRDQDGLCDWQEEIFNTDPYNPDTDGDGYLDGEEIASGYNPLRPAPDDALADTHQLLPRPSPQNLTQALIKALNQNITTGALPLLTQSGLFSVDDLAQADPLFDPIISNLGADLSQIFPLIELSNDQIKISLDNSLEAVRDYHLSLANIVKNNFPAGQFPQSAFEEILTAFRNQNFTNLKKYALGYLNSFNQIKDLTAPSSMAEFHKKSLAILYRLSEIFKAMSQNNQDPLKGFLALQNFEPTIQLLDGLLEE